MKKHFSILLIVVAGILLHLFLGRKTLPASTSPATQGGIAAGGINFSSVDVNSGLPVFDSSAPTQYIRGLTPITGGMFVCGNGMTPAINAGDGRIYCVIPADAGVYRTSVPAVAPANSFVPQGPTQSGGYLGAPPPYVPQGPTQSGGWLGGPPSIGLSTLNSSSDPTSLTDPNTLFLV